MSKLEQATESFALATEVMNTASALTAKLDRLYTAVSEIDEGDKPIIADVQKMRRLSLEIERLADDCRIPIVNIKIDAEREAEEV